MGSDDPALGAVYPARHPDFKNIVDAELPTTGHAGRREKRNSGQPVGWQLRRGSEKVRPGFLALESADRERVTPEHFGEIKRIADFCGRNAPSPSGAITAGMKGAVYCRRMNGGNRCEWLAVLGAAASINSINRTRSLLRSTGGW